MLRLLHVNRLMKPYKERLIQKLQPVKQRILNFKEILTLRPQHVNLRMLNYSQQLRLKLRDALPLMRYCKQPLTLK